MHRIILSLFACVAGCALAIADAPAAVHATNFATTSFATPSAASNASTTSGSGSSRRHDRATTRAARKARKEKTAAAPAPERVVAQKISGKDLAKAQKAAQAEADGRAERLYRASQFSAPILINAKACKRVDANGESIYENC